MAAGRHAAAEEMRALATLRPVALCAALSAALAGVPSAQDEAEAPLLDRVEHHRAKSGDVEIHYVRIGKGPLVVMIHGFPDYWYTWRYQMEALEDRFTVVAMDLRGYNESDAPEGMENYAMPLLVNDVVNVIRDVGRDKAIIIGHDWGAAIAWQFAMNVPDMTSKLIVLSVPHPSGFARELATDEEQRKESEYAREFQRPDSHEHLTAEGLAAWVRDPGARELYVEAFKRSSFDAMMNYYRVNYPRIDPENGGGAAPPAQPSWPKIQCPVLVIHGRQDKALNARGHAYTWEWIDADMTLLMLPKAGHFVQHDARELVTKTIRDWLLR